MRHRYMLWALAVVLLPAEIAMAEKPVDFNREVRPILAGRCFQCHGPDDAVRKAGLRLDSHDSAIKELKSGFRAVVPGKPNESELIARVIAEDGDGLMPPAKSGKRLTASDVGILKAWIAQGAKYTVHWSYVKPVRPPLPTVKNSAWIQSPVDAFILSRLEQEGLKPNEPAELYALIRRLSIDLIGLPPTPAEADAFVRDTSPDAYEKLVDRLLQSPAYGERWAQVWLDLARYADSQGYANDPDRTIWRWRDWLITALNDNMRYDQFTIEMLAGDLLPNPTPRQLLATGFHRNTLTNTEGGTSPEEFRSAAIVDRVNTTAQVWLGTTLACAQCHNHKYDPLSQKEYYQFYAIFNNTEDNNAGNDAPTISIPAIGKDEESKQVEAQLNAAKAELTEVNRQLDQRASAILRLGPSLILPGYPKLAAAAIPVDSKQKLKVVESLKKQTPAFAAADKKVKDLAAQLQRLATSSPILREGKPRVTKIHIRGNHLDQGEQVSVGLPAVFPPPPKDAPINRLTLARWLVSPEHPLTARVAVNRLWEELFGIGIVETSEEFGMQGELPSHPALLDWLATEYIRVGWDTKQLLKTIVMSAAYRQSSQLSDDKAQKDPWNRLASRGPRVRMSAEEVRDQALFAAGLLSPKMFGPPVQPPKPNFGLSAAFGGSTDWQPSQGEDRYRRGVYTRIRRNAPMPSMTTFDAPERTSCNIRRLRTNTPLQALVTLNDPVFVEAAQALARRVAAQSGSIEDKATHGFRLVLTRPPTPAELKRLIELYREARDRFAKDPAKATALATNPLGPLPKGADAADLAAWTVVGNVLLNLDETLAKR